MRSVFIRSRKLFIYIFYYIVRCKSHSSVCRSTQELWTHVSKNFWSLRKVLKVVTVVDTGICFVELTWICLNLCVCQRNDRNVVVRLLPPHKIPNTKHLPPPLRFRQSLDYPKTRARIDFRRGVFSNCARNLVSRGTGYKDNFESSNGFCVCHCVCVPLCVHNRRENFGISTSFGTKIIWREELVE